jgi:hypothetical protein
LGPQERAAEPEEEEIMVEKIVQVRSHWTSAAASPSAREKALGRTLVLEFAAIYFPR